MSPLRHALVDYLAVRRALGYQLRKPEKLLGQYLTYLEDRADQRVRTETALAWATLPTSAHPRWTYERLCVVRGFAAHLRALDPATEIPPANLLPRHRCRATPYLYSDEDVGSLMMAARHIAHAPSGSDVPDPDRPVGGDRHADRRSHWPGPGRLRLRQRAAHRAQREVW